MSDNMQSRSQKNKQKNHRSDLVLKLSVGLVILAVFILLFEWIYPSSNGANEKDLALGGSQEAESAVVIESSQEESSEEDQALEDDTTENDDQDVSTEEKIREVSSNDPNVIKSFVGDWEPIGTNQSGPHTTNYDDGSADRLEIKQATSQVTGVSEDDMMEYWIGNDGEQRVTATIMQISTGKYFKVYLTWNDGQGWQVTRYDEIKEAIQ